jgi:hypothetical protein
MATAIAVPRVRYRLDVLVISALVGVLFTVIWSAKFVDQTVGEDIASGVLGYDTTNVALGTGLAAAVFAFVTGLTGTFTACNIAGFSALGPLAAQRARTTADTLRSIGWLALGATSVAGAYGAMGALIGTSIPQLSSATIGGFPVRLLQSSLIFGAIGIALVAMGLAAAGVIRDPLSGLERRWPRIRVVLIGMLIGAFLIGRPFPLFVKLFRFAAEAHDPLLGAAVFALQTLGNIALVAALFLAFGLVARGRARGWLGRASERIARFNAAALMTGGTFLVAYWCLRVPSYFGIGWWPKLPW